MAELQRLQGDAQRSLTALAGYYGAQQQATLAFAEKLQSPQPAQPAQDSRACAPTGDLRTKLSDIHASKAATEA